MKTTVVSTLKNRGSTTAKDGRMLNAFAEARAGVMRAVKRPAINPAFDNLGAGPGGGLFTWTTPDGDNVVSVVNDVLNTSPGPSVRSLAFSVQPDESDISVALTPAVVVQALNSIGQVASGFTGTVVMSLSTNPTSATLGGTTSVAAVAGVATFSNLTINRSGQGFKLKATSGSLRTATSTAFNIPTRCVFTDQPDNTAVDTTMNPVVVTIQDPGGNTDTNYTGDVTLTLHASSGSGTLSGTTTKAAVAGVATFSDLKVSSSGTYDLLAEAESISSAYPPARQFSASFTIAQYILTAAELVPGFIGYSLDVPIGGSLSPDTFNGSLIRQLNTLVGITDGLVIAGNVAQSAFTTLTVDGVSVLSASASYLFDGTNSSWTWIGGTLVPTTGTKSVTIA